MAGFFDRENSRLLRRHQIASKTSCRRNLRHRILLQRRNTMAEAKADTKVTKVESIKGLANEGLLTTWIGYSTELAERSSTTAFAIARDVRSEINQRILGTLQFLESSQSGVFKLARTID